MGEHEFDVQKVDRPEADAVVYRFRGVLGDAHHCYQFLESFLANLPDAPARIVFNLQELESLYSAGIGILANCFTKAREAGHELVLAGVSPLAHRTLTITGIEPMVTEYASEDEALGAG